MKTTTENITLSQDITTLSPENLSTLTDTWLELQTSSVEVIQTAIPDIFSFAANSFFFAVILLNEQLPGGSKSNDPLSDVVQLQSVRTMGSPQAAYAQSSSTLVPADGTSRYLSNTSMCVSPEGEGGLGLIKQTVPELESCDWSPNRRIYQTDVDKLPGSNVRDDSLMTDIVYVQNPTNRSASLTHDSPSNRGYPTPHDYVNTPAQRKVIGIVYLASSPQESVPAGPVNIGIILTPEARRKGWAREAAGLVLSWVFDDMGYHRVQASILDSHCKDQAISMFTKLGFVHEGIKRRSIYCPNEVVWKDVTHLALLDTEWFVRSYLKLAPKSKWEEMFARHTREREDLLRWDDRRQMPKRPSSADTVRVLGTSPKRASATDEETRDSLMTTSSIETLQLLDNLSKTTSATDEKMEDQFASKNIQAGIGIRSMHTKFGGDSVDRQPQVSSRRKFSCIIM